MPVATKQVKPRRSPFSSYRGYVSSLQSLINGVRPWTEFEEDVHAALNGQASTELQRVAKLKTRRKFGAYFTGTDLSDRLLKLSPVGNEDVLYDPSCGMGDLLLAAARSLPLESTLLETLVKWGRRLAGTDLHEEFIEGAKTRLVLLAQQRHRSTDFFSTAQDFFPQIRVGNGLAEVELFQRATTLLMNPPFGLVRSITDCTWAGGRVSEAAIFIVSALEKISAGSELLAILPEVLRSGSFSQQWRQRVSQLAEVHTVEPYGIFDDSADVDVFLLRLLRRKGETKTDYPWPQTVPATSTTTTVADFFEVHVGRVVPHRDPKRGPRYAYIHPRCVPAWTVMKKFDETRKHTGLVYKPPFVVIRRTSRPGHPYRATATVVGGKEPVAVENHLIVCEPKDRRVKSCRQLMKQLKSVVVNEFLNERIRCRHLTVGAVSEIPITISA